MRGVTSLASPSVSLSAGGSDTAQPGRGGGREWWCSDPSKGGWLSWAQALGQEWGFPYTLPAPCLCACLPALNFTLGSRSPSDSGFVSKSGPVAAAGPHCGSPVCLRETAGAGPRCQIVVSGDTRMGTLSTFCLGRSPPHPASLGLWT